MAPLPAQSKTLCSVCGRSNTAELLQLVRVIGGHLISADPLQFSVGNCVRRVLLAIRQEFAATAAGGDEQVRYRVCLNIAFGRRHPPLARVVWVIGWPTDLTR